MELRVLQYFLAVAREQSISAAAETLHLSQPTLSRQLKDLERELGKQLMIRGSRRITLTEEGMLLRKRAEEILDLVHKTETEIVDSEEMLSGSVCIGSGETDAVRLVARAAETMRRMYPHVRFEISSGDACDVSDNLDKGLIDFGILIGGTDYTYYDYMEIPARDSWGILMRKDAPLAKNSYIRREDLLDQPLILSRQTCNGSDIIQWLQRDQEQLNLVATYNLVYNASRLVDEGLGYAFVLDKLINTDGSNLCFRPLEPRLEVGLYLVWKKYQLFSKPAEKFLNILKAQFGQRHPTESGVGSSIGYTIL